MNLNSGYPGQPPYGFEGGAAPYPTGGAAPYPSGGGGAYPNIGFPQPGFDSGYPSTSPGYPSATPGYPSTNPGYPSTSPGYPSTNPGYPSTNPGYPSTNPGYPSTAPGYSSGGPPVGYPTGGAGYPSGGAGYPSGGAGYQVHPNFPSTEPGGAGYPSPYNASGSSNFQVNPNFPSTAPQTNYPGTTPSIYPNVIPGSVGSNNSYPGSSFNQQPAAYYEATLRPYQPFNPNDDAAKLRKAMKGIGTDETTLIDILCKRTSSQRQEIAISFKTGYGKDLVKNLVDETGGNFKTLFKALMFTPAQLEAHDVKKAIEGAGTDELSLIDILCTKNNSEMIELKNAFKQMYHRDLEKEVGGDVSGYFKRLLVSLSAAHRSENPPDHHKAVQQAKELYEAGAKRLGTDEVQFNRIFASESFAHLKLVFEEYYKLTGQDIEKAIKTEMSGFVERAFLAIVGIARNPPAYFAQRLQESMAGAGTYDRALIRTMVLRSEKDMVQIKMEFQRRYGKTLESYIKADCSGDYKRGLLCLAGDPNWR